MKNKNTCGLESETGLKRIGNNRSLTLPAFGIYDHNLKAVDYLTTNALAFSFLHLRRLHLNPTGKMAQNILFFFIVSLGLLAITKCYPTGAPQETCRLFTANHTGHTAQNGRSKYDIKINPASLTSGGKAAVTIQGDVFKGFFIQAQDSSTKKPVGQFKSKAGVSQTRDCDGPGSATAATHVSADDKTVVNLEWQAPQSYKGSVVFRAVVVKSYEIFWDNVQSKPVQIA